jgi:hypothetical protein
VHVRGRQRQGEGDAPGIDQHVPLRAGLAAVGRVRAGELALPLAGKEALSSEQRDQSIAFAAPSRSSSTRWSRCQTPALCQSRKRRQQVMPQPQPISRGSISQGMPDFSTNRMPVSAAPCGPRRAGGRPWVAALVAAGAAPAKPTTDRRRVPWPWPSDGHGRGPSRGSVTRFNTTLPGSDQASAAYQGLAERIVSTQIIDLAVKNLECGRVVLSETGLTFAEACSQSGPVRSPWMGPVGRLPGWRPDVIAGPAHR